MKTYLLDTNILIALFSKRHQEKIRTQLLTLKKTRNRLATCGIVLSEFYQGIERHDAEFYSAYLDQFIYLPGKKSVFENAGILSHELKRSGRETPLGDCLVAAFAKEYGATVITLDREAGGCVRDMLLGIRPKDFDIATTARPEDLKKILTKIHPVGEKYGVVIAVEGGHHFEIATFRSDSASSDGRRPDAVLFTNPEEDALRRDFTINALVYDPLSDKIIDYIGGQDDIKNKLIRFIGNPHDRIVEDHLRIIRAIRFKNTYGFQYHPDTYAAIKRHAALSGRVSGERVRDELNKMI
ncbi:PIN domain-containing protein, partial [Candidatus Peregrinibacteria bacterium]|nr:PIN domain-containing protein [Candidatus Peregrinibacteria bacterium]